MNLTENRTTIIEVGMIVVMLAALWLLYKNREQSGRGLGLRVIQVLGLTIMVPVIVILALEGKMEAGPLLGIIVGYVLSTASYRLNAGPNKPSK